MLLSQLRSDSNGEALLEITSEAADKGWMTQPMPLDKADVRNVLLNPRFAVEQERQCSICVALGLTVSQTLGLTANSH